MMPEMDGITAMLKIREVSNVPVILLTAKSEDTDKVLGLEVLKYHTRFLSAALFPPQGALPSVHPSIPSPHSRLPVSYPEAFSALFALRFLYP